MTITERLVRIIAKDSANEKKFWADFASAMSLSGIAANAACSIHLAGVMEKWFSVRIPPRRLFPSFLASVQHVWSQQMERFFGEIDYFALTTDGWTSLNNKPFYSTSIHFLSKEFQPLCFCLGVSEMEDRSDAVSISKVILSQLTPVHNKMIENGNISPDTSCASMVHQKCVGLVADGASVMAAAASNLDVRYHHCFAHIIQLMLKDFVLSCNLAGAVVGVASKIVRSFNRSTLLTKGNNGRRLVSYSQTRFNSYLLMVRSVLEAHDNLVEMSHKNMCKPELSQAIADFSKMKTLAKVLVIVLSKWEVVTTYLGGEKYVSSSLKLRIYDYLMFTCDKMKAGLLSGLSKEECAQAVEVEPSLRSAVMSRLGFVRNNTLALVSNFLDPQHVFGVRQRMTNTERTKQRLLVLDELGTISTELGTNSSSARGEPNDPVESGDEFEKMDSEVGNSPLETSSLFEAEIESWLNQEKPSKPLNVYDFWKTYTHVRHLRRLARKILIIPATQLTCERMFSKSGAVATKVRNRLSSSMLERICVSQHNTAQLMALGIEWWNLTDGK